MVKIADHSTVIYGTHFPNRIFVGCLPPKATAPDLAKFFSYFGSVNEAKVVLDENGGSKRFGFVSFDKEEDVNHVLKQGSIFFWGKKINVGPAVKKKFYEDLKGKPATLVFDQTTLNPCGKSRVVYKPMKSLQLQPAKAAASCATMELQSWDYNKHNDRYQPHMFDQFSGIYQMPYCTKFPVMPSPMPSLIPSQSYQMASQVISVPLPSCSYAMPINSSPACGTFSGSISVSGNQDYIPPTTQFQLP